MEKLRKAAFICTFIGAVFLLIAMLTPGWMIMTFDVSKHNLTSLTGTTVKLSIWYGIVCLHTNPVHSICTSVSMFEVIRQSHQQSGGYIQYMIFCVISVGACLAGCVLLYKKANITRKRVRLAFTFLIISIIFTMTLSGKFLHDIVNSSKALEFLRASGSLDNIFTSFGTPYSIILEFIGGWFTLIAALITVYIMFCVKEIEHPDIELQSPSSILQAELPMLIPESKQAKYDSRF